MIRKIHYFLLVSIVLFAVILLFIYKSIPIERFDVRSELVMLGDLNDDRMWDASDDINLSGFLNSPFNHDSIVPFKIDINRNGLIDNEDISILTHLYQHSNPYVAESTPFGDMVIFPRPRELFRYVTTFEYLQSPLFMLDHSIIDSSPLNFLKDIRRDKQTNYYEKQLLYEIYNEAIRLSLAYNLRKNDFAEIEKQYADDKIAHCNRLYGKGQYYELLLNLIGLVEDAETLTVKGQDEFIAELLFFRDHLRELLTSDLYATFVDGKISYEKILKEIESLASKDIGIKVEIETLESPRDLSKIESYIDRAKWQYYKSTTTDEDFLKLLLYAQNDMRYLRSVSRTSSKHSDVQLRNHNLPMLLLFREALRIVDNDKMAAVGLLDEAIRIPFAWVKTIPREQLPSSIALENFLLPGNKEDGSDKSRHWNVFGGLSIYRSAKESFVLSFKRESMDLRENKYSNNAMTEFIRDIIANINGIYYVVTINLDLLKQYKE